MAVSITCPSCKRRLKAPSIKAIRKGRCPGCGEQLGRKTVQNDRADDADVASLLTEMNQAEGLEPAKVAIAQPGSESEESMSSVIAVSPAERPRQDSGHDRATGGKVQQKREWEARAKRHLLGISCLLLLILVGIVVYNAIDAAARARRREAERVFLGNLAQEREAQAKRQIEAVEAARKEAENSFARLVPAALEEFRVALGERTDQIEAGKYGYVTVDIEDSSNWVFQDSPIGPFLGRVKMTVVMRGRLRGLPPPNNAFYTKRDEAIVSFERRNGVWEQVDVKTKTISETSLDTARLRE